MQDNAEREAPMSRWFVTISRTQYVLVEVEATNPDMAGVTALELPLDDFDGFNDSEPVYDIDTVESA